MSHYTLRVLQVLRGSILLLASVPIISHADDSLAPLARVLPPVGIELPPAERSKLNYEVSMLKNRLIGVREQPLKPDVEIYAKALDYALRHGEFYADKDVTKAAAALKTGLERLQQLIDGQTPWTQQRGLVVRGFASKIDGSPQPYGLVIPEKLDLSQPVPLYVWLHGRGDKQTDLHFIHERQTSVGQISPPNAIVVHPFGRHCLGFKSAGEIDVLEAVEHVQSQYKIDPDRIVLIGFSRGGAGAWHLGAHYADRWCAVSPGAGFAETAQYNKLTPDKFPPMYEQSLWGCYDVPNYVRNLFNVPTVAYSGENDKQIQAAQIMEAAFAEHGQKLEHLIGPGVEHKYEPATLKQLLARLDQEVTRGRNRQPKKVSLQTRTLRYSRVHWVEAIGLGAHWQDSRIDAEFVEPQRIVVTTKNVTALRLSPILPAGSVTAVIDGQTIVADAASVGLDAGSIGHEPGLTLVRIEGQWSLKTGEDSGLVSLAKRPGLQGPIDDAFLSRFLVVRPTKKSKNPLVQRWVDFELAHLQDRWRAVFRGELPIKNDTEVTRSDIADCNLILWGDPDSNRLIGKLGDQLPLRWQDGQVQIGERRFATDSHVPVCIYPNPSHPKRYIVLNSGPTFREAHDRTNSLQNPKLPDWAILDISQPPDANAAGRVVAADFFDEAWKGK